MAGTNVASCVLEILSAFDSGRGVFKKYREKHRHQKRRQKKNDEVKNIETLLTQSLDRGSEDIRREYERDFYAAGDHFAVGDAVAQTTLAQTCLKLNRGFFSCLNTFLANDKDEAQLDYRALISLSDTSRLDTCRALRALYHRIAPPRPSVRVSANMTSRNSQAREVRPGTKGSRTQLKGVKSPPDIKPRRPKGPVLARVVIENSSKASQIALVKPSERRRKASSSSSNLSGSTKVASSPLPSTTSPMSSPVTERISETPKRPANYSVINGLVPGAHAPHPNSSAQDANISESRPGLRSSRVGRSTSRPHASPADDIELSPTLHQIAPLPQLKYRRRKTTPTYYSVATNSTRIGEIPLHQWAEAYDFDAMSTLNREAASAGWPLTEYARVDERKHKGGLFGLFRRNRTLA